MHRHYDVLGASRRLMFGFSALELVAIGVVAMGLFSVLGVVAFKMFEGLLEPKRWEADQLDAGQQRRSTEERELMRSPRGSFGDRLTAMERRLPALKKPLEDDRIDRLLASLPDVGDLPSSSTPVPREVPAEARGGSEEEE